MQRTSTYYKIRDVLAAASTHSGDISALAEELHGNSSSFVYFKRDEDGVAGEHPCAQSTIRRTIRFCIELGLLESEERCVLTEEGQNAREEARFDLQLQQAVLGYLSEHQLEWGTIQDALSDTSSLPHVSALYQRLAPQDLSEDRFRTCFFLLSECGTESGQNIVSPFQKKLYLVSQSGR